MIRLIQSVVARRELLGILVVRTLKIRYKDSALGFLWTMLGPVFLIVIYGIFLRLMRFPLSLPVLVTGIFVWQYLAMCLGDAAHAVIGNANLVKRASFPRLLLPLSMTLANLINFLLSLIVVGVVLVVQRVHPGPLWLLPVALAFQFILCLGMGCLLSALNVFFRDVQQMTGVVTMAWFFLTPVLYMMGEVTQAARNLPWMMPVYFLNPMVGIMELYRAALLNQPLPPTAWLAESLIVAAAIGWFGILVFQRLQAQFADEL